MKIGQFIISAGQSKIMSVCSLVSCYNFVSQTWTEKIYVHVYFVFCGYRYYYRSSCSALKSNVFFLNEINIRNCVQTQQTLTAITSIIDLRI